MEPLAIIKIGGNIIDEEDKLSAFLGAFAAVKGKKILVHGGGRLATRLAETLGIPQQLVEGRRITDAETLKIVTMVYAGYINKNIIAQLQAKGCNAVGLSGADGNAILAHKREVGARSVASGIDKAIDKAIDYGYAGDIDRIDGKFLANLLQQDKSLVFAPITHDGKGQLLNTNADTIAGQLAIALSSDFDTTLVYSFEKRGVLMDVADENSLIGQINASSYQKLKDQQLIFAGMIPKLDNAFAALADGVGKVVIGRAEELQQLLTGKSGTTITHD